MNVQKSELDLYNELEIEVSTLALKPQHLTFFENIREMAELQAGQYATGKIGTNEFNSIFKKLRVMLENIIECGQVNNRGRAA